MIIMNNLWQYTRDMILKLRTAELLRYSKNGYFVMVGIYTNVVC